MDLNPVLSEIQGLSPEAKGALGMAGHTLPTPEAAAAASSPSVLPPGMLLPHPDMGPPPGNITMGSLAPSLSVLPSDQPSIKAPRGTVEGDTNARGALLGQKPGVENIASSVEGSQLGKSHPFFGKLLGGLAEGAGMLGDTLLHAAAPGIERMTPGTEGNYSRNLGRADTALAQDTTNTQKEAQASEETATAGKTNADIPLEQAETDQRKQQTAANEPVEISPEQAQSLGMPELAGEKVSPTVLAGLSRTNQTNNTKESTTGETVAGREQVAQTGADSREAVAQTAADARKSAEDAQDRTREAVARIRGTGGAKGGNDNPTNNSKARGEMSETMLAQAPGILQEIDALNNKIGPGAGRWNNFWVKKGGANDPDYAALDQDLSLYASALAVAHFGARGGGAHFIDAMKKDFSQAQSPEDLKARILHADKWLEGYEAEGKGEKPGTPPAQPASGDIVVKPEDMK